MLAKEHFPNWQRCGQENSSLLWGRKKKNKNKKEEEKSASNCSPWTERRKRWWARKDVAQVRRKFWFRDVGWRRKAGGQPVECRQKAALRHYGGRPFRMGAGKVSKGVFLDRSREPASKKTTRRRHNEPAIEKLLCGTTARPDITEHCRQEWRAERQVSVADQRTMGGLKRCKARLAQDGASEASNRKPPRKHLGHFTRIQRPIHAA